MFEQIVRAMGKTVDDREVQGFPKLKEHPPAWNVVPDSRESYEAMAKVIAGRYATWRKKSKERRKQFASRMSRG